MPADRSPTDIYAFVEDNYIRAFRNGWGLTGFGFAKASAFC